MKKEDLKLIILAVVVIAVYGLGYGAVRWRKFIVMHEYYVKEQGLAVRRVGPGWDVRDNWRGRLKNRVDPVVFVCFYPLCALEDCVRGSTRRIDDA